MENNNETDRRDDELRGQQQNTQYESENAGENQISRDEGEDRENDQKFHEQHGNRKYESNSNHSSASDQPSTTTDTNLGRDLNSN